MFPQLSHRVCSCISCHFCHLFYSHLIACCPSPQQAAGLVCFDVGEGQFAGARQAKPTLVSTAWGSRHGALSGCEGAQYVGQSRTLLQESLCRTGVTHWRPPTRCSAKDLLLPVCVCVCPYKHTLSLSRRAAYACSSSRAPLREPARCSASRSARHLARMAASLPTRLAFQKLAKKNTRKPE